MKSKFGRVSEEARVQLEMKKVALKYKATSSKQKKLITSFKKNKSSEVSESQLEQM